MRTLGLLIGLVVIWAVDSASVNLREEISELAARIERYLADLGTLPGEVDTLAQEERGANSGVINLQVDNWFWCYAGGQEINAGVPGDRTAWNQLYRLNIADINNTPVIGCLFENLGPWSPPNPGAAIYTTSTGFISSVNTHCVAVNSRADADQKLPGWKNGQVSQAKTTQSHGKYGVGPWGKLFPNDINANADWVWPAPEQSLFAVCFITVKEVRPCDPNPCKNGATCVENGSDFTCKCRPMYEGRYCQEGGNSGYDCGARNPCTPANTNAGKFYHPYLTADKFVQCSEWGQCYVMPCGPGTKWNQRVLNCT